MGKKRICDSCGKEKTLEYGQTCEKGHFICSNCRGNTSIISTTRKYCPICKTKLR